MLHNSSNLVSKALQLVFLMHEGQKKRDGITPTILHLTETALKVAKFTLKDGVIAAALLHDLFEDTNYDKEKFNREFGQEVYALVEETTEDGKGDDPRNTWTTRKTKHIEKLKHASKEALLITLADKASILRMLIDWHKKDGEAIWQSFHAPEDKRLWYYGEFINIFTGRVPEELLTEYKELYREALSLS